MSNDATDNRSVMLVIGLFATVMVLISWDLYVDFGEGAGIWHLGVELAVLLIAMAGVVMMWSQLGRKYSSGKHPDAGV